MGKKLTGSSENMREEQEKSEKSTDSKKIKKLIESGNKVNGTEGEVASEKNTNSGAAAKTTSNTTAAKTSGNKTAAKTSGNKTSANSSSNGIALLQEAALMKHRGNPF